MQDTGYSDKDFVKGAALFGAALAICFTAVNLSWYSRVPQGLNHTGLLQSDLTFYSAIAREVMERGNGIGYVNPYSFDATPNPWLFQWPLTLMGWLWGVTKAAWSSLWELWRIFWAAGLFASLALLINAVLPEKRGRAFFFLVIGVGSGIATILTLLGVGAEYYENQSFLVRFASVEAEYHWWFLDLFRNILYPLELTYHTIVFLSLWAMLRRRWMLFITLIIAGAFSNPFAGVLVFALTMPWLLIEWVASRKREPEHSRPLLRGFLLTGTVAMLFACYYLYVVPNLASDGQAMADNYKNDIRIPIQPRSYLIAHFFLLLPLLGAVLTRVSRDWLLFTRAGRLLLVWVTGVYLLMNNHWFIFPEGIQPPHFSRGYLYVGLALIAAAWIQFAIRDKLGWLLSNSRKAIMAQLALVGILALDSVVFFGKIALVTPHEGVLTISDDTAVMVEFFREDVEEPSRILNYGNARLGVQLVASTQHTAFLGDAVPTPHYQERLREAQAWAHNPVGSDFIEKYQFDYATFPVAMYSASEGVQFLKERGKVIFSTHNTFAVKIERDGKSAAN